MVSGIVTDAPFAGAVSAGAGGGTASATPTSAIRSNPGGTRAATSTALTTFANRPLHLTPTPFGTHVAEGTSFKRGPLPQPVARQTTRPRGRHHRVGAE